MPVTNPYLRLGKYRLAFMNALMPVAGYLSCTTTFSLPVALALFGGNLFMAASSQGMGQLVEVKQDSLMRRTIDRPLVVQEISKSQAMCFTMGSCLMANAIMAPIVPMSAVLTSNLTVAFYYLYLKSKQRTKHCIHIGAVVGTMPLLVGGFAAGAISTKLLLDIAFMYSWQISHFIAILNRCQDDYKNAGFVMHEGTVRLVEMIIRYLLICGLIAGVLPDYDPYHLLVKVVLETLVLGKAYQAYRRFKGLSYPKILGGKIFDYYSIAGVYYLGYNLVPASQGSRLELQQSSAEHQEVADN